MKGKEKQHRAWLYASRKLRLNAEGKRNKTIIWIKCLQKVKRLPYLIRTVHQKWANRNFRNVSKCNAVDLFYCFAHFCYTWNYVDHFHGIENISKNIGINLTAGGVKFVKRKEWKKAAIKTRLARPSKPPVQMHFISETPFTTAQRASMDDPCPTTVLSNSHFFTFLYKQNTAKERNYIATLVK